MNARDERVEAAAFQLCMAEHINWEDIDKAQKYTFRADASAALAASDAILTNDAAIERVARVLCPMVYGVNWDDAASGMHDTCRSYAYEATSALLGEGE